MKADQTLCLAVCEVARAAGRFMLGERRHFTADKVESKGLHDYVSYVDKAAEQLIVDALLKLTPQAGFLTEEGTVAQTDAPWKWIIDPLDGTTNYIHGLSPYGVSIALSIDSQLALGVVYVVESDECFYAWHGGGAWLNGQRINVSAAPQLKDSLLITGFPYRHFDNMDHYLHLLEYFMRHTHGVRRLGSAAADLVYVACGRAEGFYEYGLQAWDVAAGALIVTEAGGQVSTFNGGTDYVYGQQIIASNGLIHDEFKTTIHQYLGQR